ncbi:hypothetical protein [Puniceibacterium sediminis]|uniref:DUF3299 domain-containing protein n=1 Tax=Puniceibacterium sediminis TaxID=1608407 RepID=A0A238YZU4_9RHOB|nr:hypothetical protein [Puniceibacterium sediminis]SNR76079.1 hypothetical protein SAMN06265370_12144 [Puniceibacterium sediminis]
MQRRTFLTSLAATMALPYPGHAAQSGVIKMRDLYNKDLSFSDLALTNQGEQITVSGFMAPPLKAESQFFVLTKMPMAICPFCEPGTTWPRDLLAIYARRIVDVVPFNVLINVTGTLELGDYVDPDLGFYSKVRIANATFARA